jgi:hypothetical protein
MIVAADRATGTSPARPTRWNDGGLNTLKTVSGGGVFEVVTWGLS